jgi:phosphoribosylanthranilate isomerase
MTVSAKICGINDAAALTAAVEGGASHVGFVFYPPSPRAVTPDAAATLSGLANSADSTNRRVVRTGLFVDPDDGLIDTVVGQVPLELLQLHGNETPERVAALKRRSNRQVMKVIRVGAAADIDRAADFVGVADWLMFDALPPKSMAGALPGGNALAFDWRLLAGRDWPLPWMLAGGLTADNVAEAVRLSGARVVDTSSGVEDSPGKKNPALIRAFLAAVAAL